MRGRSALWRNRQYNACCQKPLSRDFENHRPASKGAWLLDWPLRLMPPSDPKKPASPRAMCGRQTALVFAHACGSLWDPWAQGILWTHAFLRLPWHGWGNEQGTLAAQGFHAHTAEFGFSPENCDAPSLPKVFYLSKARRSQALSRTLKRHLRQVKDGAFCYRCKGDFPAFR